MSNNYELLLQENNELKEKISKIELELQQTKEHLKQYTAKEVGYKYEIWVYNEKGVMIDKII
jgi:hypothetical protein